MSHWKIYVDIAMNESEKEIVAVPVQIESIFRFNCRRIWRRRMTGRRRRMNRVEKRRRVWPCVALFAGKTTLSLAYSRISVTALVSVQIQIQHVRSMRSRIQIQGYIF
jgi:hypothetical protein